MANYSARFKNEKVGGSLVIRVLLICLTLVILPLIIASFFSFQASYRDTIEDNINIIEIIGVTSKAYFDEWISLHKRHLTVFGEKKRSNIDFEKIVEIEKLESLFQVVKRSDTEFICVAAANEERVGMENLFFEELSQMTTPGSKVFAAYDPITKLNQIFIAVSVKDNEYLLMGKLVTRWIDRFRSLFKDFFAYGITFIDEQNQILATDDSLFAMEAREMFFLGKLQESKWKLLKTEKEYVAVEVPFHDANFSLLIDFSKEEIERKLIGQALFRLVISLVIVSIVGGGILWFFTWKMTLPLRHLYHSMGEVSEGNLDKRYQRQKWGFEINQVGKSFNQTVDNLVSHMRLAEEEHLKTETYRKELNIAREIQKSLFPKKMPAFPSLDIACRYIPAKEVSGDFFDLFPMQDKVMLVIADASGKGVSSALYSLSVRSLFRSGSSEFSALSEIVGNTNQLFCLDTKDSGFFVTAWVGLYDSKTRRLEYSSCGHNPVLLRRVNGQIEELSTHGMALGVSATAPMTMKDVQLEKGDLLFFYTDGLVEAQNEEKKFFGTIRVFDVLQSYQMLSPTELLDALLKEVSIFAKEEEQFDDITLMAIRIV